MAAPAEKKAKPAKPSIVVVTPPTELEFFAPEPPAKESTASLTLANPSDTTIIFKVKTTAPKSYCVRPNSGKLGPKGDASSQVVVQVMLQPPLPGPEEKSKDKFLVQTAVVEPTMDPDNPDVWKQVPEAQVMEAKLKCAWRFGESAAAAAAANANLDSSVRVDPAEAGDLAASTVEDLASTAVAAPAASGAALIKPIATPVVSAATSPATVPAKGAAAAAEPVNKNLLVKPEPTPAAIATTPRREAAAAAATAPVVPATGIPAPAPSTKAGSSSAAAGKAPSTEWPSLLLLMVVFLLGYLFGKFVG